MANLSPRQEMEIIEFIQDKYAENGYMLEEDTISDHVDLCGLQNEADKSAQKQI